MAISMLQSRALSGCRAFAPARVGAKPVGTVVAHARKDSYMLEVNVGEEDTEDNAVRMFMNYVMESKVLDQLRWRRYKETNQERIKRRTKERHEIRKLKIVERDWFEWYGDSTEPHAFDQYFRGSNVDDPDEIFADQTVQDQGGVFNDLIYQDSQQYGNYAVGSQGGYMDQQGGYINQQGGYTNQQGGYQDQQGGYMDQNQQGGYINQQGGYINAGQQAGYPNQQGAYMDAQGQGGYLNAGQQQQQAQYYTQQPGDQYAQPPQ